MMDYSKLSLEIEAEYDAYCLDRDRNTDALYEKLFTYLKHKICGWIKTDNYVDIDTAEDLTQDVVLKIMSSELQKFEKKEAKFVSFCCVIAKNRALDYVRHRDRYLLENDDALLNMDNGMDCSRIYTNPERLIMEYEYRLELIAELKEYLELMINWPQKPYRTVASCYAMILFHRYHPDTKELSSPRWAYQEVENETVADSAERFIAELNDWIRHFRLDWSREFYRGMETVEDGISVGDIVFGRRFKVKDFENWSKRLREKVKKQLLEQIVNSEGVRL